MVIIFDNFSDHIVVPKIFLRPAFGDYGFVWFVNSRKCVALKDFSVENLKESRLGVNHPTLLQKFFAWRILLFYDDQRLRSVRCKHNLFSLGKIQPESVREN